jgi:hypothetical protein
MEHDFNTPQRAVHDTAGRPTSSNSQRPDQLAALREGSQARSPAPRFPTNSPSVSASGGQRSSNESRTTAPSQSRTALQTPPQQQQQQQRPQDGLHRRGRRSNDEGDLLARNRNNGKRNSAGSGLGVAHVAAGDSPWWQRAVVPAAGTSPNHASRARKPSPSGNSPDEDRRRSQRDKQISFGYATDGYSNMERLIRHDPLLKSGGLLPLSPPTVLKGSKRIWDIQLRKWRRALHMFDYVFIDGEDDPATRANVLEEQRQQWVSEAFQGTPRELRKRISLSELRAVQHVPAVPTKIPVEEDLRCILRNEDAYESVRSVVPQSASSLTKGTDISPLEAGIKIHIAPSSAVLQRQQAQQELQHRLALMQQQQQQQQQHQHSSSQQQQPMLSAGGTGAGHRTPPRPSSPASTAPPHRSDAVSPSPRRPPLSSSVAAHGADLTATADKHHTQHQKPKLTAPCLSGSPSPAAVAPTEAATSGIVVAGGLVRGSCSTGRGLPAPSLVSASAGFLSDTVGASVSPPAGLSSNHTSLSHVGGEPSSGEVALGSSSPLMTSVLLPPPPFPGVTTTANANNFFAGGGGNAVYAPLPWSVDAAAAGVFTTHHAAGIGGGGGGVLYGVPPTAVMMQPACAAPGAPWTVSHPMLIDPSTVNMPLATAMMPMMPGSNGALPCVGTTTAAAMQLDPPVLSGRLSGSLHRNSLPPPPLSLEQGVAENMHTPLAGPAREGRRRGRGSGSGAGGAANTTTGAGTPQTVPRFVARLSTSPSERRLGEQQLQQHHHNLNSNNQPQTADSVEEANALAPTCRAVLLLSPSLRESVQRGGDRASVESHNTTAAVKESKKSPSLSVVTPERSLFGAAASVVDAHTEARRMQPRDDSVTESEREACGKPCAASADEESTAVAPLHFHVETA